MEDLLAESRDLSGLLLASADLSRELFGQIAESLGVPVSVAKALCELDSPAPMSGLANRLGCDKSYVTALTDQMESLGLAVRVVGEDRRQKLLELTDKGRAAREELEAKILQASPVMKRLTKAERAALAALLQKVAGVASE